MRWSEAGAQTVAAVRVLLFNDHGPPMTSPPDPDDSCAHAPGKGAELGPDGTVRKNDRAARLGEVERLGAAPVADFIVTSGWGYGSPTCRRSRG